MIARLVIVFTIGIAAVVALVLFLSGESHQKAVKTVAALDWVREPAAYEPRDLPGDRVAIGRIRNNGPEPIEASADDFEVRDANGRKLTATLQFIDAYAETHRVEEKELKIGADVELPPGGRTPLTVRYQLDRRAQLPASVYFKEVPALALPEEGSGTGAAAGG